MNRTDLETRRGQFLAFAGLGADTISVGCPATDSGDFALCRHLIEEKLVPEEVCLQVACPVSREAAEKTVDALEGIRRARICLRLEEGTDPEAVKECVRLVRELVRSGVEIHLSAEVPGASGRTQSEQRQIRRTEEEKGALPNAEPSLLLRTGYGLSIPEQMREELNKTVADSGKKIPDASFVYRVFEDRYISAKPRFQIHECHFRQENGIIVNVTLSCNNSVQTVTGIGNGRLDAVSNAIKNYFSISYELSAYEEHSLTRGSSSKAVAYVGITCRGRRYWGAGIDNDIIRASIEALEVAVNKIEEMEDLGMIRDRRVIEILNYIQMNYLNVTLDSLSEHFYLSKPYLSKFIREKSGATFGEHVKRVRMNKARALLKSSAMTVESIAMAVGYQNVEHFNRLFKKAYNMTPVQFRNRA